MRRMVEALYSLALYLYPASFRREHGREMRQFVAAGLAGGRAVTFLRRVVVDVLTSVPREWLRAAARRRAPVPRLPASPLTRDPMTTVINDLRYSLRLLSKTPGVTAAAVVTLALGIGANTAFFSLAEATLLRPVKVADPASLVVFAWSSSAPDFREYVDRTDVFTGTTAVGGAGRLSVTVDGSTDLTPGVFAAGNLFDVLGVRALRGRALQRADDVAGAAPVAVISHAYWLKRFGGSESVLGRSIRVNNTPVTIVGVAPRHFRGTSLLSSPSLYLPIASASAIRTGFFARLDAINNRNFVWLRVTGRLREGVGIEQAAAAVEAMYRQQHPPQAGRVPEKLRLIPLTTTALGGDAALVRRFVMLLLGVVALTLLIACANVANLLLARAAARRRELGVRLALGATRARIVRQLLTESLLLAALGGAAAVAVAHVTLTLLSAYRLPGGIPIEGLDLSINMTALSVTAALSTITGLIFGIAPALRASRSGLLQAVREGSRTTTARSGTRASLVAVQVALALVLLVGSGLFLRSLVNAVRTPLGFDAAGVVSASVNLGLARYPEARAAQFYRSALERVTSIPGVTAAAWTNIVPTVDLMMWTVDIDGYQRKADEEMTVNAAHVGAGFFRTVGTRLVAGREFQTADASGELVGVVNETAARKYWPGGSPLGGRVKMRGGWLTIVGIVEDTVQQLEERPSPFLYLCFDQWLTGPSAVGLDSAHLFVRTTSDAELFVPMLRGQLQSLEPELPLYDVQPFARRVEALTMPQRMGVALFGVFSVLALTLASIGIYGVASYVAALRTREIGIRLALGACRPEIHRLVLRQGLVPVALGIAAGVALALAGGRAAAGFLYGVTPADPVTFAGVALLLALFALLATYAPARRAARVDPVVVLRDE